VPTLLFIITGCLHCSFFLTAPSFSVASRVGADAQVLVDPYVSLKLLRSVATLFIRRRRRRWVEP
jgi:hypothetical protein